MMRLKELIIEGFGPFVERQVFTFPQEPGLYFMRGENRSEPRLGANGAGKSRVWGALSWVLWDRLANGLRAADISSWNRKKETYVILVFYGDWETENRMYFLKRTWKPNSWTLQHLFDAEPVDLTKDETNPVLAMLRLQFEPFLHSVYMAQRGEMFLDMKPEPKAQLFSSVMSLDRWLDYSAKASAKAEAQDRTSRRLESECAELRGKLEASSAPGLESSVEDYERQRRQQLQAIEDDHAEVLARSKKAKQELDDRQEAESFRCLRVQELTEKRNEAYSVNDKAWKALRRAEDELLVLMRDLKHRSQHADMVDQDGSCPTCGRLFEPQEMSRLRSEALEAETQASNAVKKAQETVQELKIKEEDTHGALEALEKLLAEAITKREEATDRLKEARRSHELEERKLDRLEEDYEKIQNQANPFADMLKSQQEGRARTQQRYEDARRELDESYWQHQLYGFWVKGFKEVRLRLIGEALEELEVEVNSELIALGLVNWELRFDVDAETKKGTYTRGFSVSVLSPHNKERVAWGSWSGGEAQRLRLGAQFGLANLIRTRTGCDLPLEIWDEPTEGLSEEGITDLLNALNERALREQRTIWVVDHRSLGYGGFAGTATVIKDEKGSRIVQARV